MKLSLRQLILNAFFCISLLGVIIWLMYAEYSRPWKGYQNKFNELEYSVESQRYREITKQGDYPGSKEEIQRESERIKRKLAAVKKRRPGIKQVWLKKLGRADRCITCHQGVKKAAFSNASQPFRTHPGDYLKQHPVAKFGCVICHEGQGEALTPDSAHGYVKNWRKPVLKGRFTQSSCGRCHHMDQRLPANSDLDGASAYTKGWRLFQEYSCSGCHKLQGYNRPGYIAPDLSSISSKVNRRWLKLWLKNPRDYFPDTKMPLFRLGDDEIEYIAEYLFSLNDKNPVSARYDSDATNGRQLVETSGCLGCHTINGKGNNFGPDLSGIGDKTNPQWLYEWIKMPKDYQKNARMPYVPVQDDEIWDMAGYLMTLEKNRPSMSAAGEEAPPSPAPEAAAKGEQLVKELGCTGCHKIGTLPRHYNGPGLDNIGDKRLKELLFNNMPVAERSLINWIKTKLARPGSFNTGQITAKMPSYGFDDDQVDALTVFLLSLKKEKFPADYQKILFKTDEAGNEGEKTMEKYNCLGCHKIDNKGGDTGPDLSAEANRSRPEWLFDYLKKPYRIRSEHLLKAEMPDYSLTDREVSALINYLSFVANEPYPFYTEPRKAIPAEDVTDGEKLYSEVYACSACHKIGSLGGNVGPDHTDLASRLKRGWLERWLTDPQSVKPGVRMPKYDFRAWEFEALTNYLMTMGEYRFVRIRHHK